MENRMLGDDALEAVTGGAKGQQIQLFDVGDPVRVRFEDKGVMRYDRARIVSCEYDEAQGTWIYGVEFGKYYGSGWTGWVSESSVIHFYPQSQIIRE